MKAFYVDEMPIIGKYRIGLCDETYQFVREEVQKTEGAFSTLGSYNILAARVFGLPYPDYLRMVRDNYGAVLNGKEGYIIYSFTNKENAHKLVKELNIRWNIITKGR
jgi:hypothetical protein